MDDPPELTAAERVSVYFPWYFTRGVATLITAPLFVLFVFALAVSVVGAILQFIALARVTWAVWGWFGATLVLLGAWIPIIIPPSLYFSLLKSFPGLWIRRDASTPMKLAGSVFVIVVFPLIAYVTYKAISLGIGWIADRDPCASLEAGVTGSIVPSNCP